MMKTRNLHAFLFIAVSTFFLLSFSIVLAQPVINGACGSAANGSYSAAPTANLCNSGTAGSVSSFSGMWIWVCNGSGYGSYVASCSATDTSSGSCGSAANGSYSTAPTANLCNVGAASGVQSTVSEWVWSCSVPAGYSASCSALKTTVATVNGICGSAKGGSFTTAPTANLCSSGYASGATSSGGMWTWNCAGSGTGSTTAACSATDLSSRTDVAGACGSSQGGTFSVAPVANLCDAGSPSTVTQAGSSVSGEWLWTCSGSGTGMTASCWAIRSATAPIITGFCGSANKGAYSDTPTTNLCSAGMATQPVSSPSGSWVWSCGGSGGGLSATCSATNTSAPITGTCGPSNGITTLSAPTNGFCSTGTASAVTATPSGWTWTCAGSTGTTPTQCSAVNTGSTSVVDGTCGLANGQSYYAEPTNYLCGAGRAVSIVKTATKWTWTCSGINGGRSNTSCSANVIVDGACGSSNGGTFATTPVTGLCTGGSASTVSLTADGWRWSCTGINGGFNSSCLAKSIVNGVCGPMDNLTSSTLPTSNLCSSGTQGAAVATAGGWSWTCSGANGGTNASCSVGRPVSGACGPALGGTFASLSADGPVALCGSGTIGAITSVGSEWLWSCNGASGGTNASCWALMPSAVSSTSPLAVTLVANPSSGTLPLSNVSLTANVSGGGTGTINYTFYCNRSDAGTDTGLGTGSSFYGLSITTKTLLNSCNYPEAGTYYAKVIVERGGVRVEKRASISVKVPAATTTANADTTPPSVPSGFIAKAISSNQISLSWSTSTDNVAVKGYKIYRNGVNVLTVYGTSVINSGLQPSTTYQYTIAAFDSVNNLSRQSGIVTAATLHPDIAPPSVPQNITVWKLNTATQRMVVWSPSVDDIKVVGYRIYRNGTLLTSTTNTFFNIPVTTTIPYTYTVSAYDGSKNESSQTNAITPTQYSTDTQPPTAPSGFTATAISVTQVSLSWNASTDNARVVGYKIYRNGIKISAVAGTSFKDINLIPGTAYSYEIEAYDIVGLNSPRSAASVSLPPDRSAPTLPINLVAKGISISQIRLIWTASTDNAKVTGYKIFRDGAQIATTTSTSFTNINLPPTTSYTYSVSAYDASQNNSAQTAPVAGTTLTPDFTPPTTPTNLKAVPYSQTRINLSWTAATDNVRVAGYKIYRNTAQIGSTSALSYASAGLVAGTTYSYTVLSYDSSGNVSPQSAAVTATTLP